jgi:branched-chain amino acid transport system permease protein
MTSLRREERGAGSGTRRRLLVQIALAIAALAVAFSAPLYLRPYLVGLLSLTLIFALLAMSINLLAGWVGLVSVGHAGIMAAAGYGVAYIARQGGGHGLQIGVGFGVGLLVSLIFGVMAMRTREVYFLMITLAQGMIVWGLTYRMAGITGGENGLRGILRPAPVAPYWNYYYLCVVVFVVCFALLWLITRSPLGLTLRGLRDSESRAVALGYNPAIYKCYAFVISGFFATVAGVLHVYYDQFISPSSAEFLRSGIGVLMVILGGVGTLSGPLVGAAIVTWIENVVSGFVGRWPTVMGLIFIFVVLFARDGLVGGASRLWRIAVPAAARAQPVSQEREKS